MSGMLVCEPFNHLVCYHLACKHKTFPEATYVLVDMYVSRYELVWPEKSLKTLLSFTANIYNYVGTCALVLQFTNVLHTYTHNCTHARMYIDTCTLHTLY